MKAIPEKPSETSRTGAPRTDTAPQPAPSPPDRRSIQRLQRLAGNGAVSRLVAQRYTAPVKTPPAQSARFRTMKAEVAGKKTRLAAHAPAGAESKASQDAAVAPPDDKEAQGKAANAEKMNAAKPGEFDKKAFIDAVNKAIDAQAPKNLDEADKFAKSGKADQVKAEVDGKVTDGKETSAKDIDTATKAPPDTAAAKDKDVTPLTPDQAPGNPGGPSATDAVPEKQPAAVTDFSEGPAQNDKAMADAEVTEEQLAKGNEPEFNEALSAKKTSEADAAKAPAKGKAAEDQQLSTAKQNAAASGAQVMAGLTATRATAGKQVDGGKSDTKSKDEKKRAEVTAKLRHVYDGTKKDVEDTLSGLDKKVDSAFTSGEKSARDAFTADHKSRMKKYKDKRYSGLMGKGRWIKDKFAGLPKAANDLYQESRKLYVSRMQTVISQVADIIGAELGKAKARIAKGRTELKAEVDRLPADLKQFGQEAAKDFAGKFDDLEATVNEKSEQLVQDLAQKYTAALNKIDEEIKKLQEANKGLIDKAKDAIVGVIKTINELKNLLLGILAKAASAIMKIIKDPIGFLGNLVKAVGAGLNLFITNIADHLKTGVVSWLLGTAVKAGLDLPARFDLKGIIQLIGSMLGLTWDNIRTRVTRKGVPDEAMSAVETSVPVAKNLAAEGPAGAVKEIQAEAGDLKATILGKLTTYLIPTVLIAGITWIISLLNPASAFVRAVKGIIDIITFIVTQGAQIADFVNAVLDAVIAIANGGQAGVPKLIETALATSIPLLIGFLAALLGIGGLANKVKSVFQSVSRPVTRAIDKIVDFIAKKGKALWAKLRGKNRGEDTERKKDGTTTPSTSNRSKPRESANKIRIIDVPTQVGSEHHTLRARSTRTRLTILMASGSFGPVKEKIELLCEVSAWMKASADQQNRDKGERLDEDIDLIIKAAQKLMTDYGAQPESASRDQMLSRRIHDLSEDIHDIGVRFKLHGFEFKRPEHNLVPSAVDRYGRAVAYSGDPLSLESKDKGSASSGVYTPGIDIEGVGPLQRGHLVADLLGGPGNDPRNLSTITTATNTAMKKPERATADFIYKGDISNQVTYSVSIEHLHNDATGYQQWLTTRFSACRPDAGERLFDISSTHRPSADEIAASVGIRTLTPADREAILHGLAYYLISSRVLFSISSRPGPANTIPAPSGAPITNTVPPP
ncbi:DNA/RNA non-specific endonuclease [Streptomyces sp. ID05-18]|uniref:DNA/RNA non-specific endonuclease n=1 Tax=Streptomyces sp. ID05-18 TaxID=3028662 RepID=UPI0029AF8ACB|nr:DNA/RNA non-specific endonuclease [Streptomyces sp. ID05-18]MDX3485892.1 DNA/RNA non-specific endonuclease [Streptomyces sp. ID05-18]